MPLFCTTQAEPPLNPQFIWRSWPALTPRTRKRDVWHPIPAVRRIRKFHIIRGYNTEEKS